MIRSLLIFFLLFFHVFRLQADPVPETVPIEARLEQAVQRLEKFDQRLSLRERRILKGVPPNEKNNLSPTLRRLYDERQRLEDERKYWEESASLKKEILLLYQGKEGGTRAPDRVEEAQAIAKTAITGFDELRKDYRMIRPAFLHNIFVNAGLRKEGFCWHWTRDLRKRLEGLRLQEYELRWATAREGTAREHNTLVIVPRGGGLSEGLLLDGWRHSGSPFWTRVKGDKYPWQPGEYYEEKEQ